MASKKKTFVPRLLFSLSLACIAENGYASRILEGLSPIVMQDSKKPFLVLF